jgi:hypothetical protein
MITKAIFLMLFRGRDYRGNRSQFTAPGAGEGVRQADAADTQAREGDVGEPGEEHA